MLMMILKKAGNWLKLHKNLSYLIIYTVLFFLIFTGVYINFYARGLSFIQLPDGFHQYYPKMVYIDGFFKELFSNFLRGDFTVPQFDLNIGIGEDVLSIMGTWIMDLPFSLFTQFVSRDSFETVYMINVILKLYLAGCSFSYVGIKWGKKRGYVLAGALVYVFSGYYIRVAPMHPAFIHIFILFPLVIYGLDRIIKKKSPFLFIGSCALIMLRGYYFAYMATILAFVFGVVRYLDVYGKIQWKEFRTVFFKAAAGYILAALMGLITLLPAVLLYLSSTRGGSGGEYPFFIYSLEYYKKLFTGLLLPPGDADYPALVSVVLPFLLIPFIKRERSNRILRILLIASLCLFCVPAMGRLMNGLGYPSNRWSFAFIFLAAYCVTDGIARIFTLRNRSLWLLSGIVILYNILYLWGVTDGTEGCLVPLICLDLFVAALLLFRNKTGKTWTRIAAVCVIGFICVGAVLNGRFTFDDSYGNIAVEYFKAGTADDYIKETTHDFDFREFDSGVYRIDSTNITNDNFSVVLDVSTPSIYYSVINSAFVDYLKGIHLLTAASDFRISGVDSRVQVESLLGVKYYITTDSTMQNLPFGAEFVKDLGDGYFLYKNPYARPMIYSYDSYMLKEDYDELNVLQKQDAALHTASVEEAQEALPEYKDIKEDGEISYTVAESSGIRLKDGKIIVDSAENYLQLLPDARLEDSELYLELQGLEIMSSGNQNIEVYISYGDVNRTVSATAKDYTWHYDNEDPWVNLGTDASEAQTVYLSFSTPGTYDLESIRLFQNELQDLSPAPEEDDIKNLTFDTNTVQCDVLFKEDKILNFNIPYSDNWTLYVDGKETETFRVNDLTIGCTLSEGKHNVTMVYRTPYLKLAAVGTIIGWGIFFVAILLYQKHRRSGSVR